MRCEFCQGDGFKPASRSTETTPLPKSPCDYCGGFGIVSCCEGPEASNEVVNEDEVAAV